MVTGGHIGHCDGPEPLTIITLMVIMALIRVGFAAGKKI